jgi:hypothetical protein
MLNRLFLCHALCLRRRAASPFDLANWGCLVDPGLHILFAPSQSARIWKSDGARDQMKVLRIGRAGADRCGSFANLKRHLLNEEDSSGWNRSGRGHKASSSNAKTDAAMRRTLWVWEASFARLVETSSLPASRVFIYPFAFVAADKVAPGLLIIFINKHGE